jgi:hypothetical protein
MHLSYAVLNGAQLYLVLKIYLLRLINGLKNFLRCELVIFSNVDEETFIYLTIDILEADFLAIKNDHKKPPLNETVFYTINTLINIRSDKFRQR